MCCLIKVHEINIMSCLSEYVNPAYKATTLLNFHKILPVSLLT